MNIIIGFAILSFGACIGFIAAAILISGKPADEDNRRLEILDQKLKAANIARKALFEAYKDSNSNKNKIQMELEKVQNENNLLKKSIATGIAAVHQMSGELELRKFDTMDQSLAAVEMEKKIWDKFRE